MPSDRNPLHLWPAFWARYSAVLGDLNAYLIAHHPGFTAKLIEGFRTAEYQHELYQKGRGAPGQIVTYKDGYHNKSNHQTGMAADVGIFKGAAYIDEPAVDVNNYYGHLLRLRGLKWGGDWTGFKDLPHGEWDTTDHDSYDAAAKWLKSEGLI